MHHTALAAVRREDGAARKLAGGRRTTADHQRLREEAVLPAVPIEDSVTDGHLICLEDGSRQKSLKRHLRTRYGMTIEQYKRKWKLPEDYPVTAPALSRRRSIVARQVRPHEARKSNNVAIRG